jgi:hypothetical protein
MATDEREELGPDFVTVQCGGYGFVITSKALERSDWPQTLAVMIRELVTKAGSDVWRHEL